MSNYAHTAADALALAATLRTIHDAFEKEGLEHKESDLIVKMAEFWAEHHKFVKGDKIVYADNFDGDDIFTVYSCKTISYIETADVDYYSEATEYRPATPEEEAAGHRIDEVQDGH